MTPLGILGPLIGYPEKSYEFTGTVKVHTEPTEAESRISSDTSFGIEGQSGSRNVRLDFMKGVEDALKTTGRSVEYSPESIVVTITCAGTVCQVTASPDVISSDGLVRLESRELLNHARLHEIAEEEAAAKRKQAEEEERQRPARELQSARDRCLNAMVYGGEFIAELEQGTQALRNIVRARERGVGIDSDGRVTAAVCDNLPKAMKRLDQFLPDLEGCDEVAHSMLREEDEVRMRTDTAGLRTRAVWSKESAAQTQRIMCGGK